MKILGFEIKRTKAAVPMMGVGGWLGGWIGDVWSGSWQRNVTVDSTEQVTAFAAVFSCLSLISRDIGKLAPPCLKQLNKSANIWEEVTDNPAYSPVLRKPNRYQTWKQFIAHWVLSKFIFGNTYVIKERDSRGLVIALYILDSRRVLPMVAEDGQVLYQMGADNLAGVDVNVPAVPAKEIIHDRHTCLWHPLVGVGPIYACAMSATQGRKIQSNSAEFFKNMSRPSGQLTAPGQISDVVAGRLKAEFEKDFSGVNIGRILVAGDGLKFEPFTIPADQAQLIEQLKWAVEDVARAFQMPLYKLGAGPMPALGNIGALNLEYYGQTLQPHIEDIELLLDEGLGLKDDLCIEFDLEALLRMDPKTRAETREIEVRSATMKPNEARRAENRPPVSGGDTVYLQEQNFSLAALAKRDAMDDPWASRSGAAQPAAPAANDEEVPDAEAEEAVKSFAEELRREAA